jgi:hypothetical protein
MTGIVCPLCGMPASLSFQISTTHGRLAVYRHAFGDHRVVVNNPRAETDGDENTEIPDELNPSTAG